MGQVQDIPQELCKAVNDSRRYWDERGEPYPEHLIAAIQQVEGLQIPKGFRLTGQYRVPNIGEWYLYNQGCAVIMEGPPTTSPVWILEKVAI